MGGWEHLKQLLVKFMGQGSCSAHDHPNMLTKVIIFDSRMLVTGLSESNLKMQLLRVPCK